MVNIMCRSGRSKHLKKEFDALTPDTPPIELFIKTLEGTMHAPVGSYVIQGVRGEIYCCKEDIFLETYEPVLERE